MPHITVLEPLEAEQWFVDSPDLREFVAIAKEIISRATDRPTQILNALEPHFAKLLKNTIGYQSISRNLIPTVVWGKVSDNGCCIAPNSDR